MMALLPQETSSLVELPCMVSRVAHELVKVLMIRILGYQPPLGLTATVRQEVMSVLEGVVEDILLAER